MEIKNRNPPYKIAEVAIEIQEDGTPMYWIYNYGFHPAQGGMEFCYGNSGSQDLECSIEVLKRNLNGMRIY